MTVNSILPKFLNSLPQRFEIAEGGERICGITLELDEETGECANIERINYMGMSGLMRMSIIFVTFCLN